ncbi:MAG: Toprim subdomain protein [Thermoplasmatales archaeon]|nr:Toprim subdomain protein [Thermoplasmatales archaeon]
MATDAERLEEAEAALEEIRWATDAIVLVEGPRDTAALRSLGVDGRFVEVQSQGGPIRAAEAVYEAGARAIILTDWDRTGGRLAEELKNQLSALDVPWDADLRARLSKASKKDVKDVQSLPSMIARLRETVRP